MNLNEVKTAVRRLAMYDNFWRSMLINISEAAGYDGSWEWLADAVNRANCKNADDIDRWYKSEMLV